MLAQILRSADWRELSHFVSPALFHIMPMRNLWRTAQDLNGYRADTQLRKDVTERVRTGLQSTDLGIHLASPGERPREPGERDQARRAHQVTELYFYQLFVGEWTLLDLRQRAFAEQEDGLCWRPAAWLWHWDRQFLAALRDVYRGFYRADDITFRRGLAELSLAPAESIFRQHFGENQREVSFRSKDFVSTFHDVFKCCQRHNVSLNRSFLPLGLYLASLYEHLEALGVPVDVRACFMRADRYH